MSIRNDGQFEHDLWCLKNVASLMLKYTSHAENIEQATFWDTMHHVQTAHFKKYTHYLKDKRDVLSFDVVRIV